MRTFIMAAAAAAALAIGTIGAMGAALAAVTDGSLTVDAVATLKPNGRAIVVTGSVECDAGQRVRITANPMSGQPVALGRTAFACTGAPQSFAVTIRMKGNGVKFSDISSSQLFVRASTGDGDVDSINAVVSW